MIRKFEIGDEKKIEANEFSQVDGLDDVFLDDKFIKHTLDDNGDVKCIICWTQYSPRHYAAFFLMPESLNLRHVRALKRFIDDAKIRLKAKSCITYSFDCAMLNKWHKFLGFEKQRGVIFDGGVKNYNKWTIKWV